LLHSDTRAAYDYSVMCPHIRLTGIACITAFVSGTYQASYYGEPIDVELVIIDF
jgi:hypothetical protein